eukprot:TRINITY_DN8476_c0_g1_i1.p1 TRINITY_DN8476_c0_g1~~TRINITY_DN8476_c0_g1_i1.p1  ORF type:complete len:236 (+),score=14.16 TRINITY_DN8476_c0_g1_i1:270-977(+)
MLTSSVLLPMTDRCSLLTHFDSPQPFVSHFSSRRPVGSSRRSRIEGGQGGRSSPHLTRQRTEYSKPFWQTITTQSPKYSFVSKHPGSALALPCALVSPFLEGHISVREGRKQRAGRSRDAIGRSGGSGEVSRPVDERCRVVCFALAGQDASQELEMGSPIVIVEEPPYVKTAEPMPMMRPNEGVIKVGDVGRILDRRPKGTWAIRFAIGAYLVDRKYFQPLEANSKATPSRASPS